MIHFLYQCMGYRKETSNRTGDEAVLCEWYHPIYNPSSHLGIKIQKDGVQHYFSFSPKDAYDIAHIPFAKLRTGLDGFVIRNFDDETLLWGFRHAWGQGIENTLSSDQIKYMNDFYVKHHPDGGVSANSLTPEVKDHFKHLRDAQLLELALLFPDDVKSKLREQGQPNGGMTALHTLDLDAMIDKLQYFSESSPKWAPLAGTYSHQENTYNCASIVLTILYAGKMDALTITSATQWACIGTVIGLLTLAVRNNPCTVGMAVVIGMVSGRVLGGALDAYLDIQHFFNMIAGTSHDNCGTLLGLSLLSVVCGGIIGAIKCGPTLPAFLCLPKHVVDLAQQAERKEKSSYRLNSQDSNTQDSRVVVTRQYILC